MKQSQPKETELDKALRMGTEMNRRVHARLATQVAEWSKSPLTKPTKNDLFNIIQRYYLDDLSQNRLSRDELTFLFTFNCAKILTDQIMTDV